MLFNGSDAEGGGIMNLEDILAIDTTPIDEGMVYDISKIWVSTYVSSHLSVE